MRGQDFKAVENYTNAFLWTLALFLFMAMFTLWAAFGYVVSLAAGFFVNLAIGCIPRR